MSNKLTPEQRIEAYEYALERLGTKSPMMCFSLKDWYHDITGDYIFSMEVHKKFPEFKLFAQPYVIWFNKNEDPDSDRLLILLFCIEMAKDAKN